MTAFWFTSFSDVPGVVWGPLVPINTRTLKHRDATASTVRRQDYLDPTSSREELCWSHGDQWSGSPASQYKRGLEEQRSPEKTARHVSEILALPGTPSDYHFAILAACENLWGARTNELRVLHWIERMCLADIAMFEAIPGVAARVDRDRMGIDQISAGPCFAQLRTIYLREGFLAEAAKLEARMHSIQGRLEGADTLADRQAALRSNEAG